MISSGETDVPSYHRRLDSICDSATLLLDRLVEEGGYKHYLLVSRDPTEMRDGAWHALPRQSFIGGLLERRWL